uniref:Reverse transcriptase Ty1/copia-type domain-containing protein n=1 Tax=Trichuris muris TaxID=70415 RepID=A0A5S6QB78_TRIMR
MKPLESDSCVYSVPGTGGVLKLVAIYVDDTFVLSKDIEWIKGVKSELANTFKVRNLGPIRYGLGIQFKQNEKKRDNLNVSTFVRVESSKAFWDAELQASHYSTGSQLEAD